VHPLHAEALHAAARIQRRFITERDAPRQFTESLEALLLLTESEYGFVAELHHDADGTPWLKSHAITEVEWDPEHRDLYEQYTRDGLEFRNLDNLFGTVIKTGQTVIANEPATDSRRGGPPPGHPPLKSFLGIPFHFGDELVGMAGVANRESGYSAELISQLEPLTTACASMLIAVRTERQQQAAERSLKHSEEHFRLIADLTTEVTFEAALDTDGAVEVNLIRGNATQLLGISASAVIDGEWQEFLHPDDLSSALEMRTAVTTGEITQRVIRWIRPDGEVRHLKIAARMRRNEDCENRCGTACVDGCVVDVTDSLRAEESLRESHERQQAILQAVPDLIFLMSREGQFLEAWTADESGLLIPPDRLIGLTHRETLPAEICDQWDAAVIEGDSSCGVASFEYQLDVRGETRRYEARVTACCKEKKAVLTVVRDVTDRWEAEEAEARQFQLLKAISENTRELIFVKDAERRLLFLNAAAAQLLDVGCDDVIGTTADERLPPEISASIVEADLQVLRSGQPVTYEETLPGIHGDRVYLTSKAPWRSRSGEILGLIGIAQDITELQHAHDELRRSQQFVESIAEASPHVMYVYDVIEQRKLYANRRMTEDLGFTLAEIREMGDDVLPRLLHPDDRARLPELLQRWDSAQDGDILEVEYRMKSANGEWRWFLSRNTVFKRDADGRVREIVGTAQDITDRVVAQQALGESESRLRAIIESEPECVKLVAPDGTLLEMNAAGIGMNEAESADVILGRCVFDLVAPEDRARFEAFHHQVCDGKPGTLEYDIIGVNGTRKRMETHAVPLSYGSRGEVGHLAVTRNISETRAAEALVAEQQAQLLHVSRLSTLGQMAAAISHEITQPLSAISNYAATCRLLLNRPEPNLKAFARHIEIIAQQAHRAGDTLDRIRTFIRGADTPKALCLIDDVISGALSLMKAELRNQQTTVVLNAAEKLPLVKVDRVQIQQVITNLVTNACDAMQETAPERRRIDIECSREADNICVTVVDSGPGLDDALRDKLFEAFCTTRTEGMGLGLAICRDIVAAHGGDISATNSPDRGALFRFTLPVPQEHEQWMTSS
jgi:PAS domain S-box-containing protein